jgi:hypothetical protein
MAPLYESVPPKLYGGTERIVAYLAEELVRRGHEVTLYAADDVIKPLLATPGIEFIGEINEGQKQEFLGGALALLFPVDWPEPFGLVMIEALACGTPVIARPCGSVPEILRHGVSGFIESSVSDLVAAVRKARDLSRRACRDEFERRFTVEVMAENYETVYYQLAAAHRTSQQSVVANAALAREAARRWNPKTSGYDPSPSANQRSVRPSLQEAAHGNTREEAGWTIKNAPRE